MTANPAPVAQKIMEYARGLPEGFPLQAGGLLQYGKRGQLTAHSRALLRVAS